MKNRRFFAWGAAALLVAAQACNPPTEAPSHDLAKKEPSQATSKKEEFEGAPTLGIGIPKSVKTEHDAIHATLVEATQAPGKVGEAAQALATVLHPHFVREEEIALPPLGLLMPLAMGHPIDKASADKALKMSEALKAELRKMLDEHKTIRAAVQKLGEAAKAENAAEFERLAEELALHAQNEEEVMYPAAILVGDLLKVRSAQP